MTTGPKAAISFLIAAVLAVAFAWVAYSGLFETIETRFFDQQVRRQVDAKLDALAAAVDTYHAETLNVFAGLMPKEHIQRIYLPNQSAADVFERSRDFGGLQEQVPGYLGTRFIDSSGERIHFSTFAADIAKAEDLKIVYRNYGEAAGDDPVSVLGFSEGQTSRIGLADGRRLFYYSLPFIDSFGINRGYAVFYVQFSGLLEQLVKTQLIPLGDDLRLAGTGLILGMPTWAETVLSGRIAEFWQSGISSEPLAVGIPAASLPGAADLRMFGGAAASADYVLFARNTATGPLGQLVPQSMFEFPRYMQWILLAAFFVTVYLLLFFLLNIRQDNFAILSARIKRLQINILQDYFTIGMEMDPARWRRELEARRAEVSTRIRKSARGLAKRRSAEVDALINRNWDEIIELLSGRAASTPQVSSGGGIDMQRLEHMLKELMSRSSFAVQAAPVPSRSIPSAVPAGQDGAEDLEELDELEDIDEVEAFEDAEELTEHAGSDDANAAEEVAELAEEPASTVEAAGDEEVEELEELEELEEFENACELTEAIPVEEPEQLEVPEEIEELEELEELEADDETIEVADAVEAVEEAEQIPELEEASAEIPVPESVALVETIPASAGDTEDQLEELEELEEVEELEELEESAQADTSTTSDQTAEHVPPDRDPGDIAAQLATAAYALTDEDDDIPVIPESLGLELVEDGDPSDIHAYLHGLSMDDDLVPSGYAEDDDEVSELLPLDDDDDSLVIEAPESAADESSGLKAGEEPAAMGVQAHMDAQGNIVEGPAENLSDSLEVEDISLESFDFTGSAKFELSSPIDDAAAAGEIDTAEGLWRDEEFRKRIRQKSMAQKQADAELDDLLDGVEFALELDSLDLSVLENYRDEEGFLELDTADFSVLDILEENIVIEEESASVDLTAAELEISMLSDADRERLEELQVIQSDDDDDPEELLPLSGYVPQFTRHQLPASFTHFYQSSLAELESLGDAEPENAELWGSEANPETPGIVETDDGLFLLNKDGLSSDVPLDASLKQLAKDVLKRNN